MMMVVMSSMRGGVWILRVVDMILMVGSDSSGGC